MRLALEFNELQPGDKIVAYVAEDGWYDAKSKEFYDRLPFRTDDVVVVERGENGNN